MELQILLLLLTSVVNVTQSQLIEIQDLSENEGYIPIKGNDIRIIDHYCRIYHLINLTDYYYTIEIIDDNIKSLYDSVSDLIPMLDTTQNNFNLLKIKLDNLSPNFRVRRGLINGLGKGIKFITGNMDSDDEKEIRSLLTNLTAISNANSLELGHTARISKTLSLQIQNVTAHINRQQYIVKKYINKFRNEIENKISTLEDEVTFLRHAYQINNDINLLKNHIDDIAGVIFTSKLGIIPTDLLNEQEIEIINDFEKYTKTKVAVSFEKNQITIILSIPQFSNISFTQIVFEPMPNKMNKSLLLNENNILIDNNQNAYYPNTSSLYKNLKQIDDPCILSILNNKTANCKLKEYKSTEITEIRTGIVLFKNFFDNFTNDCNFKTNNVSQNFIIKFENCKINVGNLTFFNDKLIAKEKIIQTSLLKEVKENKTSTELNLENLYLKQINYENDFTDLNNIQKAHRTFNIALNSTSISILIILLIVLSIFFKRRTTILEVSSEPQSNGGGVMISPHRIII